MVSCASFVLFHLNVSFSFPPDDVGLEARDRVAFPIREHGRQEHRKRRKEQIHWRPDRTIRRRIVKTEKNQNLI